MTAQAVGKITNPLLAVLISHFTLVMAGVTSPTPKTSRMAVTAGIRSSMGHGETVRAVIASRAPGAGGVAGRAAGAKLPTMGIPVTGSARCRRSLPSTGVARLTGGIDVRASEFE